MIPESPSQKNDINKRLNSLKFRISAKKIEASMLFNDIISENTEQNRMKMPLEVIRDALRNQQAQEGKADINDNL